MPVCDICSEELGSETELKTHLLLSHMENKMECPLCSLSGISYDELSFHMNTAHMETDADCPPDSADCKSAATNIKSSYNSSVVSISSVPSTNKPLKPVRTSGPQSSCDQTEKSHENIMENHKHNAKQRRLSSSKKERNFSCPMCSLVCSDCFILQEHVELHLQEQKLSEGVGQQFVCPLCELVCEDSSSLQEHVELHLDCRNTGDLRLAQQLQEEEEQSRKKEEAKREAEDFKQLQEQFGLDNAGGYRKQMEKNMERAVARGHMTPTEFHKKRAEMIESLATGFDDGRTRTTGLLSAIYNFYQREIQDGARVWLCSESDHFSASEGDRGWGCGYRNFQMLLSSLQRLEQYTTSNTLPDTLPSIPQVQTLIEAAWGEGIDPQGASQFNGRLKGTRAWIGATEIYTLLTYFRLRARVLDFHQPTGPGDTHPRLFEWVKNYFSLSFSNSARIPPRVVKTNLPPIYLQHQGHSRLIIGMEERKNGNVALLLFDPGCFPAEMRKLLSPTAHSAGFNRLRKFPSHLKHKQYQVVAVEGVLSEQEKQDRVLKSRTLRAERIP